MTEQQRATEADRLDAPGQACKLLEESEGTGRAGGTEGAQGTAGGTTRVLKEQGTRTPPKERKGANTTGPEAQSPAASEKDAHDGDTVQGEDAPMQDEPELVEDEGADTFDETEDLVAYVKRFNREANEKIDRIKFEHDGKLEALGRKLQSQLKKQGDQMQRLQEKVEEGKEHTERVRQQMIHEGHKNDGRFADINRKMEEMMEMMRKGHADTQAPTAAVGSPSARRATSPWRGAGDPKILRANTHLATGRAQMMQAVQSFAAEHTTIPQDAICIAGPATSRNFVVKFLGDVSTATRRADQLFEALKDQAGRWREVSVTAADGSPTRAYLGRDRPREQMQVEVCGKRIVALLSNKHPTAEVYQTKRDGVVHVDRQQVVKLLPCAEGFPQVKWNKAAMEAVCVTQQEVLDAMNGSGAAGSAQPKWES